MRALRIVCLWLLCGPVAWAQAVPPVSQSATTLRVVATFSVLGDLVKNVGGDRVEVTVLVGPDGDAHTFEPTPKESVALARAQVVFENGFHFEHWLDGLYAASGSHALRVVVTEGIEPITLGNEEDPHVWHDVSNVLLMAERVRDGLIAVDPGHAAYYKEGAEKYLDELAKLDHWIIDTLKDIPDNNRNLFTSHDTFGYFAKRYGFTLIGAALESATTEAADPSAAQIAETVEKIKSAGVKVVFAENTRNPKLLESVAREAGVKVAPHLYTDALGPAGSDGETYIKMMRHNTTVLAEALK